MARYCIGQQFDQDQIKQKTAFHNMKAKDEKGHMRWQGAFTGGFTAGYKNTCGSKEGWTPATFHSSRQKRSTLQKQDISQFMDNQDMGKSKLSQNIKITNNFKKDERLLKIGVESSIGQEMLNRLRKKKAYDDKPEDEQDLQKLLEKYKKKQEKEENQSLQLIQDNYFVDKQDYVTLGYSHFNETQDDFINQNAETFYQLTNKNQKQETEEDKRKRKQENRISFDYSKPLDKYDQNAEDSTVNSNYLNEIVEFTDPGPQKRPKLSINSYKLKDIFLREQSVKENEKVSIYPQVPKDYDPYVRMKQYSQKRGLKIVPPDEQTHKLSIQQRSKMLGERDFREFKKPLSHDFVKEETLQKERELQSFQKEYFLMDPQKQNRYRDFVLEQQGKVLAASDTLGGLDWNKAHQEKQLFQKMYKKSLEKGNTARNAFLEAEQKKPKFKEQSIVGRSDRKVKEWRPEKLLCKRFNLLTPYMNK